MRARLRVRSWVAVGAQVALLGCGPRTAPPSAQLVIHLDTDATLPAPPGQPDQAYLFDRVRIDVLEDGIPTGVGRDFAVDEASFRERRASFGLVAPAGRVFAVRVRLYRLDRVYEGEPAPTSTLESRAALPALVEGKVQHLGLLLHLADVGTIVGYPDPVEAAPWVDTPSLVGSAVERRDCGEARYEGEACVPGGAFLLGLPTPLAVADPRATRLPTERVVLMSPFFVDTHEVTGAMLAAKLPELGAVRPPLDDATIGCNVSPSLPVNCVHPETARAYCRSLGKTLPTEAQYEYLASGRGREWLYPWGYDTPRCADVVAADTFGVTLVPCGPGIRPAGSGRLDRVALDRPVLDLAGNVAEFAADDLGVLPGGRLLRDPIGTGSFTVARGGSFLTPLADVRATLRASDFGEGAAQVGFRCVRKVP